MRLINAFELKQRILEERDKIPLTLPGAVYEFGIEKPNHYGKAMRGGIRKALRCMEQCYNYTLADTVNQTQRWIPVSERLPDEDGSYLVTTTTGTVTTARYYVSKFFPATKLLPECTSEAKWQSNRNVTHWMPLPEPPKEVSNEA